MPEATIICCDCSEWMRNGDYAPNRFEAQKDALGVLCTAKTEQNHENTVGLIAMGGEGKAEVLVNCTGDVGRILGSAHKMEIGGRCDVLVALQTAQLALKHRKNKKQSQRIILFIGSPIDAKVKPLITAAKKLKKNNVAVDVVDFGESEVNQDIIQSFLKAVNSSDDNSHVVTIPPGTHTLISDHLVSSPILMAPRAEMSDLGFAAPAGAADVGAGAGGGGGAPPPGGFLGGVDPSIDPELAEVLRLSMQEAMERDEAPATGATGALAISDEVRAAAEQMGMDPADLDEDTLLALQMSLMEDYGDGDDGADQPEASADGDTEMASAATESSATAGSGGADAADDAYMQELLSALPGLGADDIDVDAILGGDGGSAAADKKDDPKDKDQDKGGDS